MHSYAAVLAKLKPQEVLVMGPEGKRGVWRTIGSNAVFIEVDKGESVPQAIGRFEAVKGTKTESTLPERKPRWQMPSVISRTQPAPPKLGLFPSGYSRQSEAVDALRSNSIQDLEEIHLQSRIRTLDPTEVRYLQKNADLAQRVTNFVHQKLWPAWEKKAVGEDLTSLYAWQGIRAYSEQLRRSTENFIKQQFPREVSALLDNRSGKLVGPVVIGGEFGVSNDAQIIETSPTGDYTHIHSHTAAAGFGPDDLTFFLRMPNIRRMVIPQINGDIHLLEKPQGFQFNPIGLGSLRNEYENAQAQKAPSHEQIAALTEQMTQAKGTQNNDQLEAAVKQIFDANYRSTSHATQQLSNRYGLHYRIFTPRQGAMGAYSAAEEQDVRAYAFEPAQGEQLTQDRDGRYGVWRHIRGHAVFIPVQSGARTGMPEERRKVADAHIEIHDLPLDRTEDQLRSEFEKNPGRAQAYLTKIRDNVKALGIHRERIKKWQEGYAAGNPTIEGEAWDFEASAFSTHPVTMKQSLALPQEDLKSAPTEAARKTAIKEIDGDRKRIEAGWMVARGASEAAIQAQKEFQTKLERALNVSSSPSPEEIQAAVVKSMETFREPDALHDSQLLRSKVQALEFVPTDSGDPVIIASLARRLIGTPDAGRMGLHSDFLKAIALEVENGALTPAKAVRAILDEEKSALRAKAPISIKARTRFQQRLEAKYPNMDPDAMAALAYNELEKIQINRQASQRTRAADRLQAAQARETVSKVPAKYYPGYAERFPEALPPDDRESLIRDSRKKTQDGEMPDLWTIGMRGPRDVVGHPGQSFVIPNFLGEPLIVPDPTFGKDLPEKERYQKRGRALADALKQREIIAYRLTSENLTKSRDDEEATLRRTYVAERTKLRTEAEFELHKLMVANSVDDEKALGRALTKKSEIATYNRAIGLLEKSLSLDQIRDQSLAYGKKHTKYFDGIKANLDKVHAETVERINLKAADLIYYGVPKPGQVKVEEEKLATAEARSQAVANRQPLNLVRRVAGVGDLAEPSQLMRRAPTSTETSEVRPTMWNRDALRLQALKKRQEEAWSRAEGEAKALGRAPDFSGVNTLQDVEAAIRSGTFERGPQSPQAQARSQKVTQELQRQGLKNIGAGISDLTDKLESTARMTKAIAAFAPAIQKGIETWRSAHPRRAIVPEMELVPLESKGTSLTRTGMPEDPMGVPTDWLAPTPVEVRSTVPKVGASVKPPRAYRPPKVRVPKLKRGPKSSSDLLAEQAASGRMGTLTRLGLMAKATSDLSTASANLLKEVAQALGAKPKSVAQDQDPIVRMMQKRLKSMNPNTSEFQAASQSLAAYLRKMSGG